MNKVSKETIKDLLDLEDSVAISLYLPTHRFPTPIHVQEDRIRFKNLVRAAKERLEADGVDEGIARKLESDLEETIHDDDNFWQHTTEGLAVFCSPGGVRYFHLPMECEERVSTGEKFDIASLLLAVSCDSPYYLLALAVHRPVLYEGDAYGLKKVNIELPESPEAALGIDELFSNSQTSRVGGHGAGAKAHGQGDSRQAGQEERLKFFRMVDDALLSEGTVDSRLPFLLAGMDEDVSHFRELSRLNHILTRHLNGNHTEENPVDIHKRAWEVVRTEVGRKACLEEVEKLGNLLGTGRSSTDIADIAKAAHEGRVDSLLLSVFTITRDTVSDSDDEIMKLVFPDIPEKEQLGEISRAVFDTSGSVIGLLEGDLPDGKEVAAIYRY